MEARDKLVIAATIIAKKAARRRKFFMYAAALFVIFLIAIVVVISRRRAAAVIRPTIKYEAVISKEEKLNQLTEKKNEIRANIAEAGAQYGMTEKDIETMLPPPINRPPPGTNPDLKCAVYPLGGKCDERFYELKDGCCQLRDNSANAAKAAHTKLIKQLAMEIGVSIVVEEILTNLLPKLIKGEIGGKLATKLKGFIDNAAKLGKKFAPMMARMVGKVGQSIAFKMMGKAAMMIMKLLAKLGAGPVGWAMMVLDIMVILAELGDASGYNSYIENKMFIDMRNQIVYSMWEAVKKEGNDLPVVFPVDKLYPIEMEAAQSAMLSSNINEMIAELLKTDDGVQIVVKLMARAADEENGDTPGPDTEFTTVEEDMFGDTLTIIRNKDPLAYDTKLLENIRINLSTEDQNDVVLVPSMSSEKSIGISISKAAADRWNEEHKQEWFDNNDLFFPPNKPEDYTEPFAAIHTKRYLTIDENNPGTLDKPNIIFKDLPEEVTLMYPFGMLVSNCEKPRSATKYGEPIDPREFGVTFDYTTGVCNFTKDYCRRYGFDRKNKEWGETNYVDCVKKPGQAAAETILGADTTRAVIGTWEKRKDGLTSGDPNKVAETVALMAVDPSGIGTTVVTGMINNGKRREEEYGTAAAVALGIVDPLGIYENFGKNMQEQVAGRDKYCLSGDTCKRIHVKHAGGNIMNWSARGADGSIYSNGQGFQNQVKDTEDHVFFIPTDGYFKVSCQPGENRNFSYDELTDPFKVSCALGKIGINKTRTEQAVESVVVAANKTAEFANDAKKATVTFANDAKNVTVTAANDAANFASGVANNPIGAAKDVGNFAADVGKDAASFAADVGKDAASFAADVGKDAGQGFVSGANEVANFFTSPPPKIKIPPPPKIVIPAPPAPSGCVIM